METTPHIAHNVTEDSKEMVTQDGEDLEARDEVNINEEHHHFQVETMDGNLLGHTPIKSIKDLKTDMWVLVLYEGNVYIGQVISVHQNTKEVGDGAYIKCLEKVYGVMYSKKPQDFEPKGNWILHPLEKLYDCPVRVRKVCRGRKSLWMY